jgi:hypothetical protein
LLTTFRIQKIEFLASDPPYLNSPFTSLIAGFYIFSSDEEERFQLEDVPLDEKRCCSCVLCGREERPLVLGEAASRRLGRSLVMAIEELVGSGSSAASVPQAARTVVCPPCLRLIQVSDRRLIMAGRIVWVALCLVFWFYFLLSPEGLLDSNPGSFRSGGRCTV